MIIIPIVLVSAVDGSITLLDKLQIVNDGAALTGNSRNYDVSHFDSSGALVAQGKLRAWPSDSKTRLQLLVAAVESLTDQSN